MTKQFTVSRGVITWTFSANIKYFYVQPKDKRHRFGHAIISRPCKTEQRTARNPPFGDKVNGEVRRDLELLPVRILFQLDGKTCLHASDRAAFASTGGPLQCGRGGALRRQGHHPRRRDSRRGVPE